MHRSTHPSPPISFEQQVERVLTMRHLELLENIGFLGCLVLGFEVDPVGALGVGARADENELCAFLVEKTRIRSRKAPTVEFPLQRLGVVRFRCFGQSRLRRRCRPHRRQYALAACFRCVMLLSEFDLDLAA